MQIHFKSVDFQMLRLHRAFWMPDIWNPGSEAPVSWISLEMMNFKCTRANVVPVKGARRTVLGAADAAAVQQGGRSRWRGLPPTAAPTPPLRPGGLTLPPPSPSHRWVTTLFPTKCLTPGELIVG